MDAVSDLLWFSASLHLCDKMNKMNLKSVSQETIYLTGKKNSVMDKLIGKNFRPGPVRTSFLQASTMYLLHEQAVRTWKLLWIAANKSPYGSTCHLLQSAALEGGWTPQRHWRDCSFWWWWWWCRLQAWSQVFLCIKRNIHHHFFVCFNVPVAEIMGTGKRTENLISILVS